MKPALQRSYTIIAPLYDAFVAAPTRAARRRSLAQLTDVEGKTILLCGVGSGLDIPYLPTGACYFGVDITYAMLKKAQYRNKEHAISLQQGDVMQLPYHEQCFDVVIMHLILAVVPEPQRALDEAKRVLKPAGKLLVFDKFLQPRQRAPLRRLMNPIVSRIATRTDVVFEALDQQGLTILSNMPALAGGWFRHIVLEKNG